MWMEDVRAALAALAVSVACGPALADNDPTNLSLDQLGTVQVTGVSRAQERMLDAPAPVTVLTAEDIRIAGYRTLADVLNGARGTFTSTDRTYDFIGVRGFAPVGDYNTRVLLLIDGYRANDNVFDTAAIGTESLIDVDLIERVELIRGPSSSVYGANAFFGVINIVTRSASSVASGASLGAGSQGLLRGAATLALHPSDDGHAYLRVIREHGDGAAVDLPGVGRFDGVNGENVTRLFGRGVFGRWRFTVGHVERDKRSGYGLYQSDPGDPNALSHDGNSFVDVRYDLGLTDSIDWTARVFAGQYDYRDRFLYAGDPWNSRSAGHWWGTEQSLTHRFNADHRVIAGIEAQRDSRIDQSVVSDALGTVLDDHRAGVRFGVFVQDDVQWSTRWATSVGARFDDYRGGHRTSPRGALIFHPTADSALKLVAGTSFRPPNAYERYYAQPGTYAANPGLGAESIRTYDLAYDAALGETTRIALGVFRFRASNLVTQTLNPAGELQFVNLASASARGFDAAIEQALTARLRLRASVSQQLAVDANGARLENSPAYVARASARWQFLPQGWNLAPEAVWVSARRSSQSTVPAYGLVNVALTSPLRVSGFSLAVSVRNVFDRRAADPVPPGWLPSGLDRIEQVGRSWRVTVDYAF